MKFCSLFKKAINLTIVNWINKRNFIAPNLYLFNLSIDELKQVKKILFYFDNNEYMHLGDHLFFLPSIKQFIASGYIVEVAPTPVMRPLFEKLDIPLVNGQVVFQAYDLIISRIEIIRELAQYKVLLINVSKNLTMPICDELMNNFGSLFNLTYPVKIDYTGLRNIDTIKKFNLAQDKIIILFNLYCNSAAYLINQHKLNLLINLLNEYAANPEYQLVLVGSADDKIKHNFDFPYIDLRGMTSVLDIFSLVNTDNVFCYIGFDAFVMHVFSLVAKPSFVVFRGRIRQTQHNMLKKYHVNLFNHDNYVTLLN